MNKSVLVSRNERASTTPVSILGLSESPWVVINLWDGSDPVTPKPLPKHHIGKSSAARRCGKA